MLVTDVLKFPGVRFCNSYSSRELQKMSVMTHWWRWWTRDLPVWVLVPQSPMSVDAVIRIGIQFLLCSRKSHRSRGLARSEAIFATLKSLFL